MSRELRDVVRVSIPELKLVVTLPAMPDREIRALSDALCARPGLGARVDLVCAISDFHRLTPGGPIQ